MSASDYRLPWAPYTNVAALGFFALVVVLLFFTADGRTAIAVGVAWFALISGAYLVRRARRTG